MKISIAVALSLSLFTASAGLFATSVDASSVHVISAKQKNLFVFKVNKSWQGATVEVIASNGDQVSTQRLAKRKMIINFCDVKTGTYKIKITKEGHTEEFQYIRK